MVHVEEILTAIKVMVIMSHLSEVNVMNMFVSTVVISRVPFSRLLLGIVHVIR